MANSARALFPGDPAPAFDLLDQHGRIHSLQAYHGQWLILFFYTKDNSPSCSKEALGFQDLLREFNRHGAKILGVNLDSQQRHAEFSEKNQLEYSLLTDEDASVCQRYHCLFKLGPWRMVRRKTFIINTAGFIVRIHQKVQARQHARQVLDDLLLQQDLVLKKTG